MPAVALKKSEKEDGNGDSERLLSHSLINRNLPPPDKDILDAVKRAYIFKGWDVKETPDIKIYEADLVSALQRDNDIKIKKIIAR